MQNFRRLFYAVVGALGLGACTAQNSQIDSPLGTEDDLSSVSVSPEKVVDFPLRYACDAPIISSEDSIISVLWNPQSRDMASNFNNPQDLQDAWEKAIEVVAGKPHGLRVWGQSILVAVVDPSTSSQLATIFEEHAGEVFSLSIDYEEYWEISLSAVIPDEEKRQKLNNELSDFFSYGSQFSLRAPWDPEKVSMAQAIQEQKARETYRKMLDSMNQDMLNVFSRGSIFKIVFSGLLNKPKWVESAYKEVYEKANNSVQKRAKELLNSDDHDLNPEIIKIYQEQSELGLGLSHYPDDMYNSEAYRKRELIQSEIGSLMGARTLPSLYGSYLDAYGEVYVEGQELVLNRLDFPALQQGLPAFGGYLCEHGATEIHYQLRLNDEYY